MLGIAGEAFPKGRRLLKATEFRRVFESPCKVGDRWLAVLARANARDHPRLGIAAARKTVPRAVARNRIRRIVRESFRRHQLMLPGLDIVVVARKGCTGASARELRVAADRCWHELLRQCNASCSS